MLKAPTAVASSSDQLTQRSATELAAAIRAREVSSREVVEAHIELLERVNPPDQRRRRDRFDAARAEADAADARDRRRGERRDLPPLLGVPCTIKESIARRRACRTAPGLVAPPRAIARARRATAAAAARSTPARSRSASPTPPS